MDQPPDPIITLDVGGKVMRTRRSTLTRSSRYFANLFAGPFRPEDGPVFLDCDPDVFEDALYFFRHQRLHTGAPTEKLRDLALLYSIDDLLEETTHRLEADRLIGTWQHKFVEREGDGRMTLVDTEFTIYEAEKKFWMYACFFRDDSGIDSRISKDDLEDTVNFHGELIQNGEDYHVTFPQGGSTKLSLRGHVIIFGDSDEDDPSEVKMKVVAMRKNSKSV